MAASARSSATPSPKTGIVPMKKMWDNGFRQITSSSSRQLNSVDDLKGFKIRVPVTALLTSLFAGLGALPSNISYSELYRRCRPISSRGRKTRWRRSQPASSTRSRNTARCRTIAGAAYWGSETAERCPACRLSLPRFSMRVFDAAAIRERADLLEMERSLQQTSRQGHGVQQADPCNSAPRWCRPASMSNGRRPMAREALGATGEVHG